MPPTGAKLIVDNRQLKRVHPASGCAIRAHRANGLLWRASFAVPLDVVEYPEALFTLTADDRVAVALPAPEAVRLNVSDATGTRLLGGARIRRHVVAIAAGLAIATASASVVGVAAAGAAGDHPARAGRHHHDGAVGIDHGAVDPARVRDGHRPDHHARAKTANARDDHSTASPRGQRLDHFGAGARDHRHDHCDGGTVDYRHDVTDNTGASGGDTTAAEPLVDDAGGRLDESRDTLARLRSGGPTGEPGHNDGRQGLPRAEGD